MCYSIYISTTSDEDLSTIDFGLFCFTKDLNVNYDDPAILDLLEFPNKWFLTGRNGGCSCHFRHWSTEDACMRDFGPPVDWCPEEDEEIESTAAVYEVFKRLVDDEHRVDVVDVWTDTPPDYVKRFEVSLKLVPTESFRFLESMRLVLVP